jgi:hypothetical protein
MNSPFDILKKKPRFLPNQRACRRTICPGRGFPQSVTRRRGHGFGIFRSELLIIRILLAQFVEQSLR